MSSLDFVLLYVRVWLTQYVRVWRTWAVVLFPTLRRRKDSCFKRRNEYYTHQLIHMMIFWHTHDHFWRKISSCSSILALFHCTSSQTFHKTQLPYKHKPTQTKRSPILNGRQLQNKPFLLNHLPTTKMKDFIIRTACLMALATSSSHITSAHPVLRGSEKADEKQHPLRLLKKDTIPNPVPICAAGQCVNSTGGCDTIYECFMDPCELVDCGKKKICQRDFCGGCNYVCVKD